MTRCIFSYYVRHVNNRSSRFKTQLQLSNIKGRDTFKMNWFWKTETTTKQTYLEINFEKTQVRIVFLH